MSSKEIEVNDSDNVLNHKVFILDVAKKHNLALSGEQFRFILISCDCMKGMKVE